MKIEETRFIDIRHPTLEHSAIKIPHSRNKTQRDYYSEIHAVFEHQKAVFHTSNSSDSDEVCLARNFYNNCYQVPILLTNRGPATASLNEFLGATARAIPNDGYNSLKYLCGNVGVGKTAFINYLWSVALQRDVQSGKLWLVRLDVHESCKGTLPEIHQLCKLLAKKFHKVIKKNLYIVDDDSGPSWEAWTKFRKLAIDISFLKEEEHVGKLLTALLNLVKRIGENGRRLFLVFDNIDFLCHLNDRGMFTNDDDAGLRPFLLLITDFVTHFTHEGIFGSLDANILFVTRHDSYFIIQTGDNTDRYIPKREDVGFYTLPSPEIPYVYSSRKKLIEYAVLKEEKAGKRKEFNRITTLIEKHMNSGPKKEKRLAEHLRELTNHGFRDMMLFYSQYAWIGDKDLDARLIHQYPVGLLTYMLEERCRFSQVRCHFPNIYLVNIEQGDVGDNGDPYSAEHMHPHTYWLKWLIAQLIAKKKAYSGPYYVGLFMGERGDGYGEKEIRKCLGSLCQANLTNMAKVKVAPNPRDSTKLIIKRISLTKRGQHCLKHIFHRFYYLQLIVDDDLLPLPRCILDDFCYEKHNSHYGYVTAPSKDEYWELAMKMISVKARQVLLFLVVIEEALIIESILHQSIFDRLEIDGVHVPDIQLMIDSVMDELRGISSLHDDFLNVEKDFEYAKDRRNVIHEQLLEMYFI